ncbi:hypothetical protein PENTCL1PPCAC_5336, partial [Pristionchus entomophagus]
LKKNFFFEKSRNEKCTALMLKHSVQGNDRNSHIPKSRSFSISPRSFDRCASYEMSTAPMISCLPSLNWASIIVEMMSRKPDKLYIENEFHIEYLSFEDAVELSKHLPLLDKKKWLMISCDLYNHKRSLNGELNDTICRVKKENRVDPYRMLTIKLSSRLAEQL